MNVMDVIKALFALIVENCCQQ